MSTTQVTVRHNFETAHRLPFLGGKCTNLHGHSWWVTIALYNTNTDTGTDGYGIAAEFGEVKRIIRQWIDIRLDHGVMLGVEDPLIKFGVPDPGLGKTFVFGLDGDASYSKKPWPTVEAVAEMLCFKLQRQLDKNDLGHMYIERIDLQETHVNGVTYFQGA